MNKTKNNSMKAKYSFDNDGSFIIENYNQARPFSSFFPGIAGLFGTPMWVFYVNRGQCISCFGVESKNNAILEFQPANKAYRMTSLQGFRTFVKVKSGSKEYYWEPFQGYLPGTDYKKTQKMSISAHDLTITEENNDLKLKATVNYFTLPEENYSALVRNLTIENLGSKTIQIEIADGLPAIICYGLNDWLNKHLSRTVEAWINVHNLSAKAPFYQLNVEVSDSPEVKHINQGNFFLSIDNNSGELLDPIAEASIVFDDSTDFTSPVNFLKGPFKLPKGQYVTNRTPSAIAYSKKSLSSGKALDITSVYGYAQSIEQLKQISKHVKSEGFISRKALRNKEIIDEIRNNAFTNSSSKSFNLYSEYTFLDNVLRGGIPVSIKTSEGNVAFNVYSRKHGDLERDYNHFTIAPTFFSQGNGNYRDVNQNRRNDAWFNKDVKDSNIISFLNLIQADGYNPLVVKGAAFYASDISRLDEILRKCVAQKDVEALKGFIVKDFLPGNLLEYVDKNKISLLVKPGEFLGMVLEVCHKHESAEHGEGYWSDHWVYNLDLIESYLALYPEELKNLLVQKKEFTFYRNNHHILPRSKRYILTGGKVRQYKSVSVDKDIAMQEPNGNKLRAGNGTGEVYHTSLIVKILCVIANKISTLDPSGIGVEMEGGRPNWYDALNGLPGLLGSSISETLEIKRLCVFAVKSLEVSGLSPGAKIVMFEELAS
ncbi:MAG: hypothetical protein HQL27_09505, partial [Candidatus Omnitrophica bacterium]|nr:hypothetical protein [Candidatus Omnitrophota bacterium]